jgi:hypothetical protein
MTREETMLKLLALGPEMLDELIAITGWGRAATTAVLDNLRAAGLVVARASINQHTRRFYLPHQPITSQPRVRRALARQHPRGSSVFQHRMQG